MITTSRLISSSMIDFTFPFRILHLSPKSNEAIASCSDLQTSSSISTNIAFGAPRRSAPIPRIQFPAPRSIIPSVSSNGSSEFIENNHLAAVSPSVPYCSRAGSRNGCDGKFERVIARCRSLMYNGRGYDPSIKRHQDEFQYEKFRLHLVAGLMVFEVCYSVPISLVE